MTEPIAEVRSEGVDPSVGRVLSQIQDGFTPGTSSTAFRTGAAVDTKVAALTTLAVVILDSTEDSRRHIFDYLQKMEWSTQRVRIGIITDTRAIKDMRPHGWFVEHVIPRSLHQQLDSQPEWSDYALDRIGRALELMDPTHLLIPTVDGVDRQQHRLLCRDLGIDVPFDLLTS